MTTTERPPGYVLKCPGVDSYGHGLTMATVHGWGCCNQFAQLDPAEQARTGLRMPTYAHLAAFAAGGEDQP